MLVTVDQKSLTNQKLSKMKMNLVTTSDSDCGLQGNLLSVSLKRNGDDSPFLTSERALMAEIRSLLELHNTAQQISSKTRTDLTTVNMLIDKINMLSVRR